MIIKGVKECGNELAVQQLQSVQANNSLLYSKNLLFVLHHICSLKNSFDLRCESVT